MRRRKIVAHARDNQKLFVLDLIKLGKAITISHERPKHIVSKNKQI